MTVDPPLDPHQAIAEGQLVLHYQPIVRLSDGAVVAAEALVRWRHPERGLIPPARFVPALERAGLARDLTLWVMREAILQSAVWRADGEPLPVGVNLSPENLRDAHFRRFLEITLRAVGGPELLIVEIPAATLTAPGQIESLALIRERGIAVALDDVQGPVALDDVPADTVKLGRGFVARLPTDQRALEEAGTVVRAAKLLGRMVTAVGVEDDLTLRRVRALGCDAAQGFHVSAPLSTKELAEWRRRRA